MSTQYGAVQVFQGVVMAGGMSVAGLSCAAGVASSAPRQLALQHPCARASNARRQERARRTALTAMGQKTPPSTVGQLVMPGPEAVTSYEVSYQRPPNTVAPSCTRSREALVTGSTTLRYRCLPLQRDVQGGEEDGEWSLAATKLCWLRKCGAEAGPRGVVAHLNQ